MKICSVYDAEFARYGRVHSGIESAALLREMEKIPLPESGTAYEPSIAALEACEAFADYRTERVRRHAGAARHVLGAQYKA